MSLPMRMTRRAIYPQSGDAFNTRKINLSAVEPLQAWVVYERLGTALLELGAYRLISVAAGCHEYISGQKDKQEAQLRHPGSFLQDTLLQSAS